MERIIHDLVQGSPEWHQFRLEHDGASEAAAMLGLSKKVTRSELLHQKHTGIAKEFSDWVQAHILDNGHVVEALARPLVETIIGDQLYPATYSYGRLSASCDGITMGGDTAFEHKQWAAALAESVRRGELPDEHQPQCQQVLHVTGAERLIFVVSDGTQENLVWMWVYPDPVWIGRIEAGWVLFHDDLKAYTPPEVIPAAVAAPISELPALVVELVGEVKNTNLATWQQAVTERIRAIKTDLQTDQDFADAERTVGFLGDGEKKLDMVKEQALAQTATIDQLFRTIDSLKAEMRTKRLALEKTVSARKESIKADIVNAGKVALAEHVATLTKRLGKPYLPQIVADFAGVIKGKKTVKSLREAVDNELLRAKMEASEIADRIEINLGSLRELAADYVALFPDTAQIVLKANDDLVSLIKARIAEHKEAEQKRIDLERERIRQEEEAKAAAKVKAEQEAQARPIAPEPPPAAPAARVSPTAAVIEHQDEISRFLASREWGRGERDKARAILVEFVKFTSQPGRKAA